MGGVLGGFAPIWVLTAVGFAAARTDVLGDRAETVLGRFAFYLAMPAVLFTTLLGGSPADLANRGVLAFVISTFVVGLVGYAVQWRVFRRSPPDRALGAMAGCYANAGNLGIPVAVGVLGDSSFVVAVLLFQPVVVMPVVLAAVEVGSGRRGSALRTLALLPVRNPLILASLLGLVCGLLGVRVPELVLEPVRALGAAGVPTALVVLGMSLDAARAPEPGVRAELATAVALKLLLHPLVAFLACLALDVTGPPRLAAVVCAALPTAQNVYVLARRYRSDPRFQRDAVLVSTVLSMATLSVVVLLLR
ncbi:AEC family transporter [Saccharothrix syringae]|uniref:AEC family transporter n=1 Tax=Saccharothrix syringae TaxID=103733 RepID=A0A5Q0H7H1_SACSY|nr:AEC family transporter [Saccharothrix syringae]QFZ21790.1 AEC family transporter [Saccharothrix syringae]